MSGICDENEGGLEVEEKQGQLHRGSRTCRLLVFEEFNEIENLESDNLLEAYADIVDCKHHVLFLAMPLIFQRSLRSLDNWWHQALRYQSWKPNVESSRKIRGSKRL